MNSSANSSLATAGVDLASQGNNTAAGVIEWSNGSAEIVELHDHFDDDGIARLVASAAKVGIDVPLGWPAGFVDAVAQHARDGTWPADYEHAHNRALRYRATDIWLQDEQHFSAPLSVSTDRISIPAMRAAAVLNKVTPRPDLDGSGVVVEVYPAAALRRWGLSFRGYKGVKNADVRRQLVTTFRQRTSAWLTIRPEQFNSCCDNDNVFDAVICALVARATLVNLTERIPLDRREAARREGWIAVPRERSLEQLANGEPV
jgi:predicted nuclease with RNAse H fold